MQAHCSIFWCVLQRIGTSSCTFFIFFDGHKYLIVEFSCTSWWTRFLSDWSVAQVVLNSDNSLAGPESPCGGFKSEHQLLSLFFLLFSCTCSSYWPIKILFCTKALLNTCIYNRLSAVVAHFFKWGTASKYDWNDDSLKLHTVTSRQRKFKSFFFLQTWNFTLNSLHRLICLSFYLL